MKTTDKWPVGKEQPAWFERLNDDVLRLVLADLSLDDTNHLFNVVEVSKRLYFLAMPLLYRDTTLDLARSTHQRLLRRLTRPGAQLPHAIRIIRLKGTSKQTPVQLLDLYVFFGSLTDIREFHWHGTLSIPHRFLEVLSCRHPTAEIYIDAQSIKLGVADTTPTLACTVFTHLAGTQLREFTYTPIDAAQMYGGFKLHLIQMLKRCHTLRALTISWTGDEYRDFPEVLAEVRQGPFTKLRELRFLTPARNGVALFTAGEVSLLRAHGCWDLLETLSLEHVSLLPHFLTTYSKLRNLWLYHVDQTSWNVIESWLDENNYSFENLANLQFFGIATTGSNVVQSMVPWAIVRRAPKVTTMLLHRAYYNPSSYLASNALTVSDVEQLRTSCPGLTYMSFDIAVRGKWPTLKNNILHELAQFPEAIEVELYLHMNLTLLSEIGLNRFKCRRAFNRVLHERRQLGLPCDSRFQIGFKVVRPLNRLRGNSVVPDYNYSLNKAGEVQVWRQNSTKLRETLHSMGLKDLMGRVTSSCTRLVGWGRGGYTAQLKRQEINNQGLAGFSADSMLYDLLT
ncbi:hypothetical protein CC86DRAFT_71095 [Ophiobolus disseminans]|uniref:F-box domain-containing protein n=1 Tax=Ophiobolus disseminans TaxID=1469910 RepID=A0A6A6ZQQ1_9PLEO|nr:hypothetical protein CC86DRAFT_71095 [Ophiobolus disseminans]